MVCSGDTRPCQPLVALGEGASLLIHEATFETALATDARHKQVAQPRHPPARKLLEGRY